MKGTSIVGVWSLRSFLMEDLDTKARSEPFGPAPRGTLILHPGGHMAALIVPREQSVSGLGSDQQAVLQTLVAYSGRYGLEPPNRLVTAVDVASIEAWIGTDQARTYAVDGDRLELRTPPGRVPRPDGGEATVIGLLSWSRAA